MVLPSRALQLLRHVRGKKIIQMPDTRALCQNSFSLQQSSRKLSFPIRGRGQDVKPEAHSFSQDPKLPNWCKYVLAAIVVGGLYEAAKFLKWKGKSEKLIYNIIMAEKRTEDDILFVMEMYFLLDKMERYAWLVKNHAETEDSRYRYYWLLLQKIKFKYEEAIKLDILKEYETFRSEIGAHKTYDVQTSLRTVVNKRVPTLLKLEQQRVVVRKRLTEERRHYSGAKIQSAEELVLVISEELCPDLHEKLVETKNALKK